eukprot:CAMPEP_0175169272 /NCGR_PEP_ID=MMETSP0087-20121206/29477_1 /TAXON_ID=136419 /ORGANISM="Unknown Unknown, Strain D1" /LENGTH=60 /DNA_ID=CAMNT_0016459597 /DNA_START=78 /DNA_END=260 /DNA_ORIENTATION=-
MDGLAFMSCPLWLYPILATTWHATAFNLFFLRLFGKLTSSPSEAAIPESAGEENAGRLAL